ncbi:zinc finger protein 507 isoform 2-T2 [Pholidichthys leucotaenia]
MEEISNATIHSSTSSTSSEVQTQQIMEKEPCLSFQPKHADYSLTQVIEKLSRIVEKRPQRQKRALQVALTAGNNEAEQVSQVGNRGSPHKRIRRNCKEEVNIDGTVADSSLSSPVLGDGNNTVMTTVAEVAANPDAGNHKRTVTTVTTSYQCSLCPYLSQTLQLLKEHLKQHNEHHSDLILMCSECHFASRDQEQLEAHVRMHFDSGGSLKRSSSNGKGKVIRKHDEECGSIGNKGINGKELSQKKKWYSYEEYGLYRCLICSYVCSQQRMLKTHAWKHAGLVDCSYPIFEDEDGGSAKKEAQATVNSAAAGDDIVIISPVLQNKGVQKVPTAFKVQLCVPVAVNNKREALNLDTNPKMDEEEETVYPIKDLTSEEPMVEVQVTTEADSEVEIDSRPDVTSVRDSLLSSAQKIINSSPNSAGHINVIVERLPSAEDSVMVTNPLLLQPDMDVEEEAMKDEVALSYSLARQIDSQILKPEVISSVAKSSDSPRDENIPPAGRKRTHSESLRLHSLAAEALMAMPMRTPELPSSSTKVSLKSQSPQTNQKPAEVTAAGQKVSDVVAEPALLNLELHSEVKEEDFGDEESPTAKAGISLSLLTVIERLRERSDQNATDEDILKELQDNSQFHNGAVAGMVTGNGEGSYVCSIAGMDGLVGSADGGLVDYIPGSERPYRCRLCRYSSKKGYIKQHLRVHRQRQPYQCPICEHIAVDSKDLENHMIHHCKNRMYQCKQCPDAFHYKSQLRSHEREHHSLSSEVAALTPVAETVVTLEESEREADEECSLQKMYKCDVCNYTSSTYVGVRNHRRIHNSDKPYRCSLCGYVCSHPPSLKSHMWKHAGDQNYNYEQVNKAINEAISQSSRSPQKLSAVLESVTERTAVAPHSKDASNCPAVPVSMSTTGAKASLSVDGSVGLPMPTTNASACSPKSFSPQEKNSAHLQSQSQSHLCTGLLPAPGPGMEYCVLLFCCCICGFESTSKERLMEHMKEHEGDIISIILNKEQQQESQPAE